jgi:hypothetical protein
VAALKSRFDGTTSFRVRGFIPDMTILSPRERADEGLVDAGRHYGADDAGE